MDEVGERDEGEGGEDGEDGEAFDECLVLLLFGEGPRKSTNTTSKSYSPQ